MGIGSGGWKIELESGGDPLSEAPCALRDLPGNGTSLMPWSRQP